MTEPHDHLPKGKTVLSRDQRPIRCVFFLIFDGGGYWVGPDNPRSCTLCDWIEAYDEGDVPWIAIFNERDEIVYRFPAQYVTVHYR